MLSFHRTTLKVDPDTHIDSLEKAKEAVLEGTSKWSCKIAVTGTRVRMWRRRRRPLPRRRRRPSMLTAGLSARLPFSLADCPQCKPDTVQRWRCPPSDPGLATPHSASPAGRARGAAAAPSLTSVAAPAPGPAPCPLPPPGPLTPGHAARRHPDMGATPHWPTRPGGGMFYRSLCRGRGRQLDDSFGGASSDSVIPNRMETERMAAQFIMQQRP